MDIQHTNALTPVPLTAFAPLPFTPEQFTRMHQQTQAPIAEQDAFKRAHPVTTAYLIATKGSLTREGGAVFSEDKGRPIKPDNDTLVNVARVDDQACHPDATPAKRVADGGEISAGAAVLAASKPDKGDNTISSPGGKVSKIARAATAPLRAF